jgi:hypothetical protein
LTHDRQQQGIITPFENLKKRIIQAVASEDIEKTDFARGVQTPSFLRWLRQDSSHGFENWSERCLANPASSDRGATVSSERFFNRLMLTENAYECVQASHFCWQRYGYFQALKPRDSGGRWWQKDLKTWILMDHHRNSKIVRISS